jgi:hypothetical protein
MRQLWQWLRPLVPFFRFFDDVGPVSKILWRAAPLPTPDAPWTLAFVAQKRRSFLNLLLNQKENQRLWAVSQFERLVIESQAYINRPSDFANTSIYRQCRQLVSLNAQTAHLQFKVQNHAGDDVFVSPMFGEAHD